MQARHGASEHGVFREKRMVGVEKDKCLAELERGFKGVSDAYLGTKHTSNMSRHHAHA